MRTYIVLILLALNFPFSAPAAESCQSVFSNVSSSHWFKSQTEQIRDTKYSRSETLSLLAYLIDSASLNSRLREKDERNFEGELGLQLKSEIKNIDRAFKVYKVKIPMRVYRGLKFPDKERYENYLRAIQDAPDAAYVSTSRSKSLAEEFAGRKKGKLVKSEANRISVLHEITLMPGTRVIFMPEILNEYYRDESLAKSLFKKWGFDSWSFPPEIGREDEVLLPRDITIEHVVVEEMPLNNGKSRMQINIRSIVR